MLSIESFMDFDRYNVTQAASPTPREYRIGWIDTHKDHVGISKSSNSKIIIIGDSIAYGLSRYPKVWHRYFAKKSTLNLGIPGDKTQHVLWRLENVSLPDTLEYAVVHCGCNNLSDDSPRDIAGAISKIAFTLLQ